jgi:hypothetical protein
MICYSTIWTGASHTLPAIFVCSISGYWLGLLVVTCGSENCYACFFFLLFWLLVCTSTSWLMVTLLSVNSPDYFVVVLLFIFLLLVSTVGCNLVIGYPFPCSDSLWAIEL